MNAADLMLYGLLVIPFLGTLAAGYAKLRVGPFLGLTAALGAVSVFLSYIFLNFSAAMIQFGALALGIFLFFLTIGLLGERVSYRSPMLLLASVALFPLGLILAGGTTLALLLYGILIVANILFALLLTYIRRNSLTGRKGREKPKNRFMLTIPTIVATVVAGLTVLAQLQ